MLNEFDIRDWEKVDFKALDNALDEVDSHVEVYDAADDPYVYINMLKDFLKQMELLRDKQIQLATKHIAAVEKKGFHG
jgi:DNA polymerase III psi subunit